MHSLLRLRAWLLAVVVVVVVVRADDGDTTIVVRPNQLDDEVYVGAGPSGSGVRCVFGQLSTGGAQEEWSVSVRRTTADDGWSCSVTRPSQTSYLFFRNFFARIERVADADADADERWHTLRAAEAYTFDNAALLREEAFTLGDGDACMRSVPGWSGELHRIELLATDEHVAAPAKQTKQSSSSSSSSSKKRKRRRKSSKK